MSDARTCGNCHYLCVPGYADAERGPFCGNPNCDRFAPPQDGTRWETRNQDAWRQGVWADTPGCERWTPMGHRQAAERLERDALMREYVQRLGGKKKPVHGKCPACGRFLAHGAKA